MTWFAVSASLFAVFWALKASYQVFLLQRVVESQQIALSTLNDEVASLDEHVGSLTVDDLV